MLYAVPRSVDYRYTYQIQASERVEVDSIQESNPGPSPDVAAVTTGETIGSLRQLLHRANWVELVPLGTIWEPYNTAAPTTFPAAGLKIMTTLFPRIPAAYGKNPLGTSFVARASDGTKYDAASQVRTPFLVYLINCFIGYRGSVIHHFNIISNGCDYVDTVTATRENRSAIITGDRAIRNAVTSWGDIDDYNLNSYLMGNAPGTEPVQRHESGWEGTSLTNPRTQSAMSVSVPYYSKWRFRPAWEFRRDLYPADPTNNEYSCIRLQGIGRKVAPETAAANTTWPFVDHYISGGTDFNPVFFLCAPTTFIKTVTSVFNTNIWTPPVV